MPTLHPSFATEIEASPAKQNDRQFGSAADQTILTVLASRIFGAEKGILATAAIGGLIPDSVDRNLAGLVLIRAVRANMLVKIGVVTLYVGFKRGRSAIMALSAGAASLAGACAVVIFT